MVVVLGSSGSIGKNTLEICKKFNIEVEALVVGNSIELLNEQIEQFKPKMVAVAKQEDIAKVKHDRVYAGEEGILQLLEECEAETIVNALVGFAGLKPTLKTLELGKKLALANKESLVVAGKFIDTSKITPIDSEHFALWYLVNHRPINRLYITASGGAFRDWDIEDIKNATFEDALKHPNWSMGNKITIDSASMVNKLFELLEARWLFGTADIEAYIERTSMIHALVEFKDGSTTAHLSNANMQLPIAYAIKGEVQEPILEPLNLLELKSLEFKEITQEKYPMWQIKEHLLKNPDMGVVLNAANEVAIKRFESGEFGFFKMTDLILQAYEKFKGSSASSLEEVFEIDAEVREFTKELSV